MEKESIFLLYVRRTLKKWAGFQAAIDHGMGGPYAKEKESWLGNEIENYFKKYDDVRPEDIESYLSTMMENEFETYFEDGSLEEVSQMFCHAYELYLTDPEAHLFQHISSESESNSSTADVLHKEALPENSVLSKMENLGIADVSTTDDDGWTVVSRKGKRNRQ